MPVTAPSISLKDVLVAASVGVFNAVPSAGQWLITIGSQPAEPDDVITLYDTGGLPSWPKWLLDFPDVTINIRSDKYQEGWDKMYAVRNALLSLPAQVINGDRYDGVIEVGTGGYIGKDTKNRSEFSITFRGFVEPQDTSGNYRVTI